MPTRKSAYALSLAALALYICYLPRFYVGSFNDDALYVLAAKALWKGCFCRLSSPIHAPITSILPGYPLFLMPFEKLFEPHWAWLKITTIGLTLATGLLLPILWKKQSPHWVLGLTLFFLCNPIVALYSGSVMTDPCFSFAVLLAFVVMREAVLHPHLFSYWVALGLILCWTCLIRPVGTLLPISMGMAFCCARSFRGAGKAATIFPLFIFTLFMVGRPHLTHKPNSYLEQWKGALSTLSQHPFQWLYHASDVLRCFFAGATCGFPYFPGSLGLKIITYMLIAITMVFMGLGYWRLLKKEVLPREVTWAMGLWMIFYLATYFFWTTIDYRYAVPLVPWTLSCVMLGLESVGQIFRRSIICFASVTVAASLAYGALHVQLIRETWSAERPPESLLPAKTYQWIVEATSPQTLLYSKGDVTFLYTGRRGMAEIKAFDARDFHDQLRTLGISYIVSQARHIVEVKDQDYSAQALWNRNLVWAAATPDAFQVVYENSKERTRIYKVL